VLQRALQDRIDLVIAHVGIDQHQRVARRLKHRAVPTALGCQRCYLRLGRVKHHVAAFQHRAQLFLLTDRLRAN